MVRTLARRPAQVELIRRSIVDDPATVAARVALVRRSGRLVDMTKPRQLPDGRALVVVTLLPLALARPAKSRRRTVVAVAATAGTVVLAATVYALYAVAQLVEAVAANAEWLVGGLLILAAVFVWRVNHRAACPGLHCGRCQG